MKNLKNIFFSVIYVFAALIMFETFSAGNAEAGFFSATMISTFTAEEGPTSGDLLRYDNLGDLVFYSPPALRPAYISCAYDVVVDGNERSGVGTTTIEIASDGGCDSLAAGAGQKICDAIHKISYGSYSTNTATFKSCINK